MRACIALLCAIALGAEDAPSWIDTHAHLDARIGPGETDFEGAAKACIEEMDRRGIARTLLLPPPFPPGHPNRYDSEALADAVSAHPGRFAFLGGGGTLNAMIHEAAGDAETARALRRRFVEEARAILDRGAVGFGEIAIEHLSHSEAHPYERVEADHPLLLLLADFAAKNDVPIDVHMDPADVEVKLPSKFASPPNPESLRPNVEAFERLLAHNAQARFVWAHGGWDQTGRLTTILLRRLLAAHDNLYVSLKIDPLGLAEHSPLGPAGEVRPEWLELFRDHPDRFVIGSDQFYLSPRVVGRRRPPGLDGPAALLAKLPADLATRLGRENAERIYRLGGE